jgi:hypothetical protein
MFNIAQTISVRQPKLSPGKINKIPWRHHQRLSLNNSTQRNPAFRSPSPELGSFAAISFHPSTGLDFLSEQSIFRAIFSCEVCNIAQTARSSSSYDLCRSTKSQTSRGATQGETPCEAVAATCLDIAQCQPTDLYAASCEPGSLLKRPDVQCFYSARWLEA